MNRGAVILVSGGAVMRWIVCDVVQSIGGPWIVRSEPNDGTAARVLGRPMLAVRTSVLPKYDAPDRNGTRSLW